MSPSIDAKNSPLSLLSFFFFNDTATTEIYTLSLHDALPIYPGNEEPESWPRLDLAVIQGRSEEHTSELQSRLHLVCRLLLEKKKNITENKQQQSHRVGSSDTTLQRSMQ